MDNADNIESISDSAKRTMTHQAETIKRLTAEHDEVRRERDALLASEEPMLMRVVAAEAERDQYKTALEPFIAYLGQEQTIYGFNDEDLTPLREIARVVLPEQ